MRKNTHPRQTTPKGHEIPIPTHKEFFENLEKVKNFPYDEGL